MGTVAGTKYKHLKFLSVPETNNREWSCYSSHSGEELGVISWRGTWKRWVFNPESLTYFSQDCLNDIADFIGRINKGE